jgi:hypothetical protein
MKKRLMDYIQPGVDWEIQYLDDVSINAPAKPTAYVTSAWVRPRKEAQKYEIWTIFMTILRGGNDERRNK